MPEERGSEYLPIVPTMLQNGEIERQWTLRYGDAG